MLAQILDKHGLRAKVVGFAEAEAAEADVARGVVLVCFSSIEPLSTLHLRLAGVKAHRRLPDARVTLCIWQRRAPSLITGLTARLRVDAVATTMSDALEAALNNERRIRHRSDGRRQRSSARRVSMRVNPQPAA